MRHARKANPAFVSIPYSSGLNIFLMMHPSLLRIVSIPYSSGLNKCRSLALRCWLWVSIPYSSGLNTYIDSSSSSMFLCFNPLFLRSKHVAAALRISLPEGFNPLFLRSKPSLASQFGVTERSFYPLFLRSKREAETGRWCAAPVSIPYSSGLNRSRNVWLALPP